MKGNKSMGNELNEGLGPGPNPDGRDIMYRKTVTC